MTPRAVDGAAAGRFVEALFASAPAGSLVEVRVRRDAGMRQTFHGVEAPAEVVAEIARSAAATDVFVGVLPRARRGGGRRDLVERASVLWVDCDTPAAAAALRAFRPEPSIVVASGGGRGHVHAYWLLRDPVAIDAVERGNRRLAWALGADLACSEPARILRPAGSVWHKSRPPVAVRLLQLDAVARHVLGDVVGRLEDVPVARAAPTAPRRVGDGEDPLLAIAPAEYVQRLTGLVVGRAGKVRCPFRPLSVGEPTADGVSPARSVDDASSTDRAASDPLLLVPPLVYFERLTGLRVGPSGKLHCLFHDDRSPSLHVYREPARGWYCFGCGRGGSVYDLAAELSGLRPRGVEFLRLRALLEQRLLGASAGSA